MSNTSRRWIYVIAVALLAVVAAFAGWIPTIMGAISHVLALYFAAWLIQFFFTPAVDTLSRRGLPRVLSVSCVYLMIALGLSLFCYATIPGVVSQGQKLTAQLANPHTYRGIQGLSHELERIAETRFHVPHSQIQEFTENYSVSLRNGAVTLGKQLQDIINTHITPSNLSNSASTVLNFLNALNTFSINLLIVLILAFYMMLDGHKLVRQALAYFPPAADEIMEAVHQIINRKFGGYIRSQVILALSFGFLTYIISVGFDLHYSILISVFAAVAMLIPFIGAFISIVPPLIAYVLVHAGASSFPIVPFVLLFLALAVAQHVVLNLLAPRVMGNALGMHPLLVMLGLLLGAELGGLWGAIFGVPILGVVLDIIDLAYRRVIPSRYGAYPRLVHHKGKHVPASTLPRAIRHNVAVAPAVQHEEQQEMPAPTTLTRLQQTISRVLKGAQPETETRAAHERRHKVRIVRIRARARRR